MKRQIGMLAIVAVLAACSGNGNTAVQQAAPQQGAFALQAQSTGGGAQVTLRSLATAGTVITLVGQLKYDTARLQLTDCAAGPEIGAAAGKTLHFKEPVPGVVRTVVEGGMQPLPPTTDVLTCTFAAVAGAPSGPASVRAEGNVADMSFVDRPFTAEATVTIGK